jgi:hypothetical protein
MNMASAGSRKKFLKNGWLAPAPSRSKIPTVTSSSGRREGCLKMSGSSPASLRAEFEKLLDAIEAVAPASSEEE